MQVFNRWSVDRNNWNTVHVRVYVKKMLVAGKVALYIQQTYVGLG